MTENSIKGMRGVSVLAIIPARGGSKGMPRKNLRPLGGIPLLVHTIRHAKAAKSVQRVVVSTEDQEIADVAEAAGAEVVRRPLHLATDESRSEPALLHTVDVLERQEKYRPDLIVFLQCTSPLRSPDDIDKAVATLVSERANSLFSACKCHSLLWSLRNSELCPINYNLRQRERRQDMPVQFEENGSIYVMRLETLRKTENRLGGRIAVYEMSTRDSFQVDTEDSWKIIELLYNNR